jgi:hypothetical protein
MFNFAYIIKINEMFIKLIDYLDNYIKIINNLKLILNV